MEIFNLGSAFRFWEGKKWTKVQPDGVIYSEQQILTMPYILKEHEKDLINFKYKGGSASITYEYLWSPFGEFLLKFVPTWVAPNLITFVAFVLVFLSHLVVIFYDQPFFGHAAARWKLALFAVTMFVYQHLDNLDGKQARKTKSSSPVGMLFDHGTDALTSLIFGIQIMKVIQVQDTELGLYAIAFIIMLPNFAGLWTQYGVGEFKLDRINPIDEGLPSYQLLALGGYFFDYSFWQQQHILTSYNMEFLLGFSVVVVIICTKMCKNVLKQTQRSKQDMLSKLALPAILIAALALIRFGGLRHELYVENFYYLFYILLLFWGRNLMLMQVCSVTNQTFNVFNRGTNFFIAAILLPFLIAPLRLHLTNYLLGALVIQSLLLFEFIYSFLNQATSILGIRVFKIKSLPETKAQ